MQKRKELTMDKPRLEAAKQFRKHYKYAMRLKEGGKAWDREMRYCEKYMRIVEENKRNEIH